MVNLPKIIISELLIMDYIIVFKPSYKPSENDNKGMYILHS